MKRCTIQVYVLMKCYGVQNDTDINTHACILLQLSMYLKHLMN